MARCLAIGFTKWVWIHQQACFSAPLESPADPVLQWSRSRHGKTWLPVSVHEGFTGSWRDQPFPPSIWHAPETVAWDATSGRAGQIQASFGVEPDAAVVYYEWL